MAANKTDAVAQKQTQSLDCEMSDRALLFLHIVNGVAQLKQQPKQKLIYR